ncbi:MAG: LuxR family transcriptional regulator [Ponticaulis sp.]|nr:LuxR family transcriptional regulator [Ponticaulis sp.]|tara:strand:+ start:2924 stop:3706 length:783 start_codon:yes stop_codon:yes gene_type:complete
MLFDTHVNLHGDIYDEDREDVIQRAREQGVELLLSICDKIENIEKIQSITENTANMWRSVGTHPHYAKDHLSLDCEQLSKLAEPEDVVGIGETGLDLHYGYSDLDSQKQVFQAHIDAAQETGLPLIVHTREADDLTGDMLEAAYARTPFKILMHCYTSGEGLARRAIDLDAYFSVSGIATFKNAHDVRAVAKLFPADRVILETDCPYLAPVPMRGRRNEPAYLTHICEYFAGFTETSFDELAERTTQNALRLFDRIKLPS